MFSHYALVYIQVSAEWVYWGSSKKFPRKKTPSPKRNPNPNLTLTLTLYGSFFVGERFPDSPYSATISYYSIHKHPKPLKKGLEFLEAPVH